MNFLLEFLEFLNLMVGGGVDKPTFKLLLSSFQESEGLTSAAVRDREMVDFNFGLLTPRR